MLREPFPSDLGLSDLGFGILDNLIQGRSLSAIDAGDADLIDELKKLRLGGLVVLSDDTLQEPLQAAGSGGIQETEAGRRLLNTLVRKGDCLVFFHQVKECDGQASVHPIVCLVIEDAPLEAEAIRVWFSGIQIDDEGQAVCADYSVATVSPPLLMRLTDYCENQPAYHTDDVSHPACCSAPPPACWWAVCRSS